MAKQKKNTQAWAITYADMVTLLLTFFVLLMVILSEAEKQVDLQIQKLLDNAYEQMLEELDDENIDVERVSKGVKITIRGKLFEQLSPNISSEYLPKIAQIGGLIKETDLMKIDLSSMPDSSDENFALTPLSLYAKDKVANEEYLQENSDSFDFSYSILRFATAFLTSLKDTLTFSLKI